MIRRQKVVQSDLVSAYLRSDREHRLLYSKVGCVLCVLLVAAGSSLDYFVYPEFFWALFRIRLICNLLAVGILFLHYTPIGRRRIRVLGLSWIILVQAAISWMIYITEGAVSPYYAGLNLAILGAGVALPFTVADSFLLCVGTLVLYLGACLLHSKTSVDWSILFNNLYFLVLSGIICVVSSFYTSRRRFDDFRLRHELGVRNEEIARSYEQLAELDQLKSDFFANVSHELRTPLTLILSPVQELLGRETLSSAAQDMLRVVRQNSLRLLKLINDLLELVRLEEGRTRIEREPLDLAAFVPGMAESVRHLAEEKGLNLRAYGRDETLIVQADRGRLEKVLLNLLINAIKFTPAPGTISARWYLDGASAVVEVEDTGIGISRKDLPFVFDRFRQADGSSTRKYQGSGIGLALARELVEEHGGHLEAQSELGKGTVLRMSLPVAATTAAEVSSVGHGGVGSDPIAGLHRAADYFVPVQERARPEDFQPLGSGPFTVMVVEDDPDMRRFLTSVLAEEYRVLQAADGQTGLAMIRKHRPHLVLLDLMLPGMDGLGVCEAVKGDEETKAVKVVLLTARTDEGAKLAALERGADDFLLKPFSTMEVKTRMANLVRAAELEEDLRERNAELEDALARLQEAEAQLVQTEKMNALGNLAAGLLHEINNPLNYTLTALQVAEASVPDEDGDLHEILEDIGQGMGRIRDIVSDLRSFAYPSSESQKECFELTGCLETALRLASHEVNGVEVLRETPPGCVIEGAQTQITHLLINLLTNSAQALHRTSEDRTRQIRVSATPEGDRLSVRVWDNGVGIEPGDLTNVFNPFFTTREVGDGMGLGLSICHTIVKNHGGTIVADSKTGQWTEIRFDLPLASRES